MTQRALMAEFDTKHRLHMPGGYWVQKDDDNRWQVGHGVMFLGFSIESNVPVGRGGSMDSEIRLFVEAMGGPVEHEREWIGFEDLRLIGPTKPLGYLPISTIEERGKSRDEIVAWAQAASLRNRVFTPEESMTASGAVYVWDELALQALLHVNLDILNRTQWPTAVSEFVEAVANRIAHDPALYELIGIAFNDPRMIVPQYARRAGPSRSGSS